jgi:hypothetical protein
LRKELSVKVQSLLMREVVVEAAEKEKEVVVVCAKVGIEWAQVTVGTQKWCEKLKTQGHHQGQRRA